MTPTIIRPPRSSQPAWTGLVVEPDLSQLIFVLSALSSLRFDVTVASTFKEARNALTASRPMILIADLRLGEYNGLHLVLRGKSAYRHLPALITSHVHDEVLQREAEQLGATYVTLPTEHEEFVAAVSRTILRADVKNPVRPPFERRQRQRRSAASTPVSGERRFADRRRELDAALQSVVSHF